MAWQCGEPTMMGLEFFRRAVELVAQLAGPGQRVGHTMRTNGTLIGDHWAAFLAEHDFLVGVSIDGPRELHDVYRLDEGGKPTFDRVIQGLDKLKAHGARWNVLTTVHRANQDQGLDDYRFLNDDLGAEFVQLIPIVERPSRGCIPTGGEVTECSVSPRRARRFLVEVFEEWARRDVGRVYVQMFDSTLASFIGVPGLSASTARLAAPPWPWSTTGTCTPATILSSYLLGNIAEPTCSSSSPRPSNRGSATRSGTRCRHTAVGVMSGSPVTADARRTASRLPLTASWDCHICVRATRTSSGTSIDRCASWLRPFGRAGTLMRAWPGLSAVIGAPRISPVRDEGRAQLRGAGRTEASGQPGRPARRESDPVGPPSTKTVGPPGLANGILWM